MYVLCNAVIIWCLQHWINPIAQGMCRIEGWFFPDDDPMGNVLSAYMCIAAVGLLTVIFIGRCLWLLASFLIELVTSGCVH